MGEDEFPFVVQEHHARNLHYDFRLEIGGVLKSWAIPKGPSLDPAQRRLAIEVDDHPLEYIDFEGIIPEGMYGAGAVLIWDKGTYKLLSGKSPEEEFKKGKLFFELNGNILRGGFSLFRIKGKGPKNWLLVKKTDSFSMKGWKLKLALTEKKKASLKKKTPPCDAK